MPVSLGSKLSRETEPRIEVVPLIDIMFFLLASFMLVSLSMVNLRSVDVELPSATTAVSDDAKNLLSLTVDAAGLIYIDGTPFGDNEALAALTASRQTNASVRVLVSGDKGAVYGAVMRALDLARLAGHEKIAFEIDSMKSP